MYRDLIYDNLAESFPRLFRRYKKVEPGKPFQPIEGFGIECESGWYNIIWETADKLEKYISVMPPTQQEHYYVVQIKEKWGILEIYMSSYTDEMFDIISEASNKSAKTCEFCGKTGKLRGKSWYITLCDSCYKTRLEERGPF